ncbi:hypothetical protein B0T22DRAFT_521621 [Podospora appendiculata]|uniref:Uncharacterized protein n=1 Tax=Podospora appendiculata TaxID=314037 RepID=A0AAE0X0L1_9PEZI|nr:hypothetical protein B0T22DRAFT_521621 [Podospora appendiculata]
MAPPAPDREHCSRSAPPEPTQTSPTAATWSQIPLGPPPPPGLLAREALEPEQPTEQNQSECTLLEGFSVSSLEVRRASLRIKQVGPVSDARFSYLAVCANAALETLELPNGRESLRKLGCLAVKRWTRTRHEASGSPLLRYVRDVETMSMQVDVFLRTIRRDFPLVVMGDTGRLDTLAYFHKRRSPEEMLRLGDAAPLLQRDWKAVGYLLVNKSRVKDMARTHAHLLRTQQAGGQRQPGEIVEVQRFVFCFACDMMRELAHLFISMTSQGLREVHPTRRLVECPREFDAIAFKRGMCGRGLQMLLFGGTIDVMRGPETGDHEAGIPVIRDDTGAAYRVLDMGVQDLVEAEEGFIGELWGEDTSIPAGDLETGVYRSMDGGIIVPDSSIRRTVGWSPEPDAIFAYLLGQLREFAQSRVVVSSMHDRARDVKKHVAILMPA